MGPDNASAGLTVTGVRKSFDATTVLTDVSLTVPRGELHALLGASGSGKTTLLRIVGGFTEADSGTVTIDGIDVTTRRPEARNAGFVFQNYALFPHLNAGDNIAFGLRLRKIGKAEIAAAVRRACDLTRIPRELLRRKPNELSGGQQQRVAIARALATKPAVLLLDEPLSALDRKVRQEVREELKRVQREAAITTVFVTHDQEEALYLADRVLVMEQGIIVQSGDGADVYGRPQSRFVAGFVGSVNLMPADITWVGDELATVMVTVGGRSVPIAGCVPSNEVLSGHATRALAAVRPEQLILTRVAGPGDPGAVGTVAEIDFTGPTATVRIAADGRLLSAMVFSRDVLGAGAMTLGDSVSIEIAAGTTLVGETP